MLWVRLWVSFWRRTTTQLLILANTFAPLRTSTYIKELHVITSVVKEWRQYLFDHPFIVIIDQKSLKDLMSQSMQTHEQQIYLSKQLGYDYSIQYRVGRHNVVTNALSRPLETLSSQFLVLSISHFVFFMNSASTWLPTSSSLLYFKRWLPLHLTLLIIRSTMGFFFSGTVFAFSLIFLWRIQYCNNSTIPQLVVTWVVLKLFVVFNKFF